ncbi:hypothetical protein FGIG_00339 [Fasciola gigantica]|uniref:Uncharacterized protein n=1 Tax=Fasciola gigantica TaxID=46835 RepID=A0A504YME4_FASGI|nr:hypothetical protein FGIG_00339 [Fasciola gigantica]
MNVSQYFLRVATKSKSVSSALEDYELLAALLSGFSQGINKTSYSGYEIISLIFYIFYRRYGWDECPAQQLGFQVYMPSVAHRLRSSTRDDEMRYKERIVTISSDLISW